MQNIFITSIFRSGSTLLSMMLKNHPQTVVGWQPYLYFYKACRNLFYQQILNEPMDPNFPMGIATMDQSTRQDFNDVFEKVAFRKADIWEMVESIYRELKIQDGVINQDMKCRFLLGKLDDLSPGSAGEVLKQLMDRLYLSLSGKNKNKISISLSCAKEVFNEEYMSPLINYTPLNARVIHLIRDPRAVVASRNYGKYVQSAGSRYPLMFILKSWLRSVHYYQLNAQNLKYLMIKYEDLVLHPERVLRKICEFLELPFSKTMLDTQSFSDTTGKPWRVNSSFESGPGFAINAIDRWRRILPENQVQMIEYICLDQMSEFGYTCTNGSFERMMMESFNEDWNMISPWLRKHKREYWPTANSKT